MDNRGFTLVEMIVVVFILTTAILGIGASATYMIQAASTEGVKSEALQAVEGRISLIVMDPRYGDLGFLYANTESNLPGLQGFDLVTQITHVETPGQANRVTDYKVVMVSVSGPGLAEGLSRTIVVGSP
jgi:prepilin-type N-terminal cleavage/methylation domain-containing protein